MIAPMALRHWHPLGLALLPLASWSAAPPTDVELRAAYCVPVMQNKVQSAEATAAAYPAGPMKDAGVESAAQATDDLNRLRAYIVPKLQYLDSQALLIANTRGQQDVAIAATAHRACFARCEPANNPNAAFSPKYLTCLGSCQRESPAILRTGGCTPLNWLPF